MIESAEAPLLVGLLANHDPAAKKYAEWTGKACRSDGLRYELRELADPIDVEAALMDANDDPRVHGIIVYYPIFGQKESYSGASQDDYLRDSVSHRCDVEGLCHTYRTNLYRNVRYLDYPINEHKCLLPCTALSVVKILEQCPGCYDKAKPLGQHMEGKVVTVINRSEIVGRPLAAMLANDGAEVYSVDISSIYKFSGGRLHPCDETPESCVRKVRSLCARVCERWVQDGLFFQIVVAPDGSLFVTDRIVLDLRLCCCTLSRPWSLQASRPRTIVSPLNGSNRTLPW